MPDPPDGKWSAPVVVTKGMTPEQWVAALNAAISVPGYPIFSQAVPSPNKPNETWVSVYLTSNKPS